MKRNKAKQICKIKHHHILGRVILLFISILVMYGFISFFMYILGDYLLHTKMTSEYMIISNMAGLYEKSVDRDSDAYAFPILDSLKRDYIIQDSDGGEIHSNRPATITKEKFVLPLTTDFSDIEVYKDADNYFMIDRNGDISLDYKSIFKSIWKNKKVSVQLEKDFDADEEKRLIINLQDLNSSIYESIQLPIWISIPVKEGQERFIGKAFFNINFVDLGLFFVFIIIMLILGISFILFLFFNIIHEIRHYQKSKKLLFFDDVTKGYNYNWFLYAASKELSKMKNAQKKFAVIDLQFLKYRNFCACHSIAEGEKQLKLIHDTVKKGLQKNEILAHSTPANFVLVLESTDIEQTKNRMQDLIRELEHVSREHSFKFHSGITSVAVWKNASGKIVRRKNYDPEIDYNNACTARATLNESEDSGVAVFDDKIIEEQKWKNEVQEEQMNALKNEEFIVYYQPKYNPGTEKLCGAEALIRWQSPKHGFVPPGRFIPIFEKNGFITEIDHYMLSHVARDMKQWQDAGMNCVPVSVNVSRAHFIETDLAEQIRDIVDEAGADRRLIEIELTESAFFDDKKALVSTILKLKEYGFAVSMDDFGSGYSSLNSLKDMPLDILKIDAEFFRGESADTRGKIVVSETIKLAKSLNMRTVAEGVEIKEQVDFLAEQGCDMIQGFYFAKPMPKNEFEDRMK